MRNMHVFLTSSEKSSFEDTVQKFLEPGVFDYELGNSVLLRHHSVQGSHEIAQSNPRNQCESFRSVNSRSQLHKIFKFKAKKQRSTGLILCDYTVTTGCNQS